MFEIRVICDPNDTDRVVGELDRTFTTGTVTVCPTRDGQRDRLYVRADHRPADGPTPATARDWPTPETAYKTAPSIISEIGWTTRTIANAECFTELEREYYLRKAALLDRIALLDEPDHPHRDTVMTADAAAVLLLDTDKAGLHPDTLTRAEAGPRRYVRRAYAAWQDQARRRADVASGRCPNCQWPENDCNCADHPDA